MFLYEGHPKSLLEAMSCGVNCIATNVEGITELLKMVIFNCRVKRKIIKIKNRLLNAKKSVLILKRLIYKNKFFN